MKKVIWLTAALFAAAVFSSVPAMAQTSISANAVVTQYQILVAQYQSQKLSAAHAKTLALVDIQAKIQAMIEATPDQKNKELIVQAALEAAAVLCVAGQAGPAQTLCNDAISAVLSAATAAGMSADDIAAIAAASAGVDQDLIAADTAAGGAGTGVVVSRATAPGGTGFGGGSGGGGGTASIN